MKKRWLSAALCTAMVAGSLAGCGLKSPETTTTAAATEAAKEEATTAAEAKEESKGESAAAGEPVGPAVIDPPDSSSTFSLNAVSVCPTIVSSGLTSAS